MNLLNAFLKIPQILNSNLTPEKTLELVKGEFFTQFGFDFVMIGYLNAENIEIKTATIHDNVNYKNNKILGKHFQKFINSQTVFSDEILPTSSSILSEIGIEITKKAKAIILPLKIREAIFGIIVCLKFADVEIPEDQIAAMQAYAEICSYTIKDAELSNVFKLQLKILNENVVEKTYVIEDMKEQNEKIIKAEQLKTEFLMNMSHALRTPLNAIIGLSEALEMKIFGDLNEKQTAYVLDIQNSGKEMLGLINDILDMSKLEAGAMKVIKSELNVINIIKEVLNVVKSLANKKNIDLVTAFPKDVIKVPIDEQKFNQIMYNLLSNAIKFTQENGKIEVGIIEKKNAVQIYVKDNGIGIDPKYHGKIFGKFEQVDNSYGKKYSSTGLGLTITKELIELHNGKIWLESKLNNGTTFTFELPLE